MEDPLHYGKLDHPGKRVTTLPASSAGEYGKLDRVSQTCVQGIVVCVLWGRCVCCGDMCGSEWLMSVSVYICMPCCHSFSTCVNISGEVCTMYYTLH